MVKELKVNLNIIMICKKTKPGEGVLIMKYEHISISMCFNQDYSVAVLRSGTEFQNMYLFDLVHNLKHH